MVYQSFIIWYSDFNSLPNLKSGVSALKYSSIQRINSFNSFISAVKSNVKRHKLHWLILVSAAELRASHVYEAPRQLDCRVQKSSKIVKNIDTISIKFGFNYLKRLWLMWGVHVCLVFRHLVIIQCKVGNIWAEFPGWNYDLNADVNIYKLETENNLTAVADDAADWIQKRRWCLSTSRWRCVWGLHWAKKYDSWD